ncbi:SDR family oxidoreductase [Luteococcus japonicus]|uniref:Putative oxidoreductase n=1 Tax=Luteococcus japonicus LSP_Lj1 TaxID=1255658 RepID=A0A1R4IYW0_9ACTN|nr:SDR family oxidoreductase [Luteococcus japonicus]SJN24919.1 Putative oxidoreductase [Luteococcus japonicus LSP_Lj1]
MSEQRDQLTFANPVTRYEDLDIPEQSQPEPGLDADLTPKPDRGEKGYRGTGRLAGRKALVTGGDSGIGAAVAIAFAREGADVAFGYLPAEEEDARTVSELIEAEGRKAVKLPADITTSEAARGIVDQAAEALGGLDILVNNAGHQKSTARFEDLTDDQLRETFDTNILAMFWTSQQALKYLPEGATIINSTSVQAYQPSEDKIDYASTKAAINNFTKGLAQYLAPKGIRVNGVAPGPIWTPLQVQGGQQTEDLPDFGKPTALGRAGHPVELAPAYVFLASPESSYVVGETLNVNGGMPTP